MRVFKVLSLFFIFIIFLSGYILPQEKIIPAPSWEKIIIVPNEETKLKLDLWLNKPEGSVYRIGEDLKIYVRANDDCYLYIFDLTADGEFKLIFPNVYSSNNFIRKDQTYTFPDKPSYSFKVSPPEGKEFIIGIISKVPLNIFPGKKLEALKPGETLEKSVEKAMKTIEKVLIEGDKKNWSQKVTFFYVQRAISLEGKVNIQSNPSGANVYLNNVYKGKTPLSLSLTEGSYRVLLQLEGYKDYETVIIVEANKEKDYNFTLSPKYGDLRIESTPSNADVYIDGIYRGKTPLLIRNMLAKTYEIRLRYPGYQDLVQKVEVKEGRENRIVLSLLPLTGSLNINSNPQGAEVYLNGVYKGITPITIYELTPGKYQLQLRKSGYKDLITFVDVISGTVSNYNFSLTPLLGSINVFSTPSNADVYINDVYKGKTPLSLSDLNPGYYTVRIVLTGYQEYRESFYLNPGDVKRVNVNLVPALGEVSINSKPQSAVVYIDGKYQGVTPLTLNLAEGVYSLRLALSGYQEVNTQINVKAGEKYNFEFVLSPIITPVVYYINFTKGGYEGNLSVQKAENCYFTKEDKEYSLVLNPGGILELKSPSILYKKIYLRIKFATTYSGKSELNPGLSININEKLITIPVAIESKDFEVLKWDITGLVNMDKENIVTILIPKDIEGNVRIKEISIESR